MKTAVRADILPPLAFGEAQAVTTTDARIAEDQAAKAIQTLEYIAPACSEDAFRFKSAAVSINGLRLEASASSPIRLSVGPTDGFHLLVPFFGQTETESGGRHVQWNANENAILATESGPRRAISGTRSVLFAELDRKRLIATASAMLGVDDPEKVSLATDETRTPPLNFGRVSFTSVFRQLCLHIDSLMLDEAAMERLGLDDMFYRHAVCLLKPELFLGDGGDKRTLQPGSNNPLDAVCEAVRNRRHRPLRLTEMEQISGLSRRSLQYAFQKRFGCSPMAWQQQERLHIARERLAAGAEGVNVTGLAYELGFSNPSSFASFYRRMFGERPSETILRSRASSKQQ
ncbi:AraC family transcriptional regulator [Methylocystis sp. WRRC1]|uniref:helix-turn-helix domain-containing protein n=1 Tax=Methylocystis sp. WRRC1 TaxID=1732014 RepID=UPI001D156456|nr:helix-turn-helix domain-containing protein [Methylocystis sp. WRRC1]MCC3243994.1 AraC family transcriptional regulator [Methylocystis sp. WRRC1]